MRAAPLPLAPRPHADEALSSWVRRIAARYDLGSDNLVRHVLGQRSLALGRVERLDSRADPELEGALARAARIDVARIQSLRIVKDDDVAWCWHRIRPAWCPECIRGDLAHQGEVHERAIWRLGCCVLCPDHRIPLEDTCRRCMAEARCHFHWADGLLRLACDACGRLVDPTAHRARASLEDEGAGAFGVRITPPLTRLVADLQGDVQGALAGSTPRGSWGLAGSAKSLVAAVGDLALCIIVVTRIKFEPRIELPELKVGQGFSPFYEPVTPAALPQYAAYGVLAVVAGFLESLAAESGPRRQRGPDPATALKTASSFVARLPADGRRLLQSWAATAERPAGRALRAVIAAVDSVG